jgi:hypothetical protein
MLISIARAANRCIAAAIVLIFASGLVSPSEIMARVGEEGGCLAEPDAGCITKNGAYEDKYCAIGPCYSCGSRPDAVCTWCHDLEDYFSSDTTGCPQD